MSLCKKKSITIKLLRHSRATVKKGDSLMRELHNQAKKKNAMLLFCKANAVLIHNSIFRFDIYWIFTFDALGPSANYINSANKYITNAK